MPTECAHAVREGIKASRRKGRGIYDVVYIFDFSHFYTKICCNEVYKLLCRHFAYGVLYVLPLLSRLVISPDSRWQTANQTAAQRQTELETCVDRLGSFAAAADQLGPWLREKELMMSVLGPLSIDPNMLNTQKQQVQVGNL